MGTTKPDTPKPELSVVDILTWCTQEGPELDDVLKHCSGLGLPTENYWHRYAKPGLPSSSSRYSPRQLKGHSPTTMRHHTPSQSLSGQGCLTKHTHPEGRVYFQLGQFVTSDDMQNPDIEQIMPQALALVFFILKQTSKARSTHVSQRDVEFCIELESLTLPPEFNYYIVDRKEHLVFWADNRRPSEVENASEAARGVQ
ncbi:hypothetical protein FRC12_012709 [Ceratobasidium sp. 428]|nr:hypothetical protein FRC12_012709 [Ceratobasidium sp. 428]